MGRQSLKATSVREPQKSVRHQMAANQSWANTPDWAARTKKARDARWAKYLAKAGGDPKRAAKFYKADMQKMLRKSVDVRAARKKAALEAALEGAEKAAAKAAEMLDGCASGQTVDTGR
jgi:hypothetical protein